MAEKSFGIKELNLIGASGTPTIESPNNLNLNAVNVAISTNVSVGGTLTVTGDLSVTGNIGVGGTLTYEDVTNVDSIGIITARSGIRIGATGANTLISGTATGIGIGEDSPDSLLHIGKGTNADDGAVALTIGGSSVNTRQSTITKNNVGSGDRALEIRAATGGSDETIKFFSDATTERLRIGSSGQIGIAGANYGTSGQVLTSQGASSAVQWASISQPDLMADTWRLVTQFINAQTTLGSGGSDWERDDTYGNGLLGTGAASAGMSVTNGYFSFPTTGFYSVRFYGHHSMSYTDGRAISGYIVYTANNFSSSEYATYYTVNCIGNTGQIIHGSSSCEKIFDITDVSNQKFKLAVTYAQNGSAGRTTVDTNANRTYVIITRLGDT